MSSVVYPSAKEKEGGEGMEEKPEYEILRMIILILLMVSGQQCNGVSFGSTLNISGPFMLLI